METDPTTPSRLPMKRPLDIDSGETPAPKRVQRTIKITPHPELKEETPETPSLVASKKRKSLAPRQPPKAAPSNAPSRLVPPPQLYKVVLPRDVNTPGAPPAAIEPPGPSLPLYKPGDVVAPPQPTKAEPPPKIPSKDESQEAEKEDGTLDLGQVLNGLQDEWEAEPTTSVVDISKVYGAEPETQMNTTAPTQQTVKREWLIVRKIAHRPDLLHHSDNPFDFLPAPKLDMIIRFWRKDREAANKLSRMEKELLGEPRIKKILAKVVHTEALPIEEDKKNAWIRSAILSAITQNGAKAQDFARSRIAINPAKPGYNWVIIPVGSAVFKALRDTRAALDPRSGTLVLFRLWEETPFPAQRIFAFGIHNNNDSVPFDVTTRDYMDQMDSALTANGVRIAEMTPTYYGDTGEYCTEVKFDFADSATPFLINPERLARRFWTGLGNSKTARTISYKWPVKCEVCESEAHLTSACPWQRIRQKFESQTPPTADTTTLGERNQPRQDVTQPLGRHPSSLT